MAHIKPKNPTASDLAEICELRSSLTVEITDGFVTLASNITMDGSVCSQSGNCA
jgi:hypothetical protein